MAMPDETISPSVLSDEEYDARFEQEVAAYVAMHPQLLEKYTEHVRGRCGREWRGQRGACRCPSRRE